MKRLDIISEGVDALVNIIKHHDKRNNQPGKVHYHEIEKLRTFCGRDTSGSIYGRWSSDFGPVNCERCLRIKGG